LSARWSRSGRLGGKQKGGKNRIGREGAKKTGKGDVRGKEMQNVRRKEKGGRRNLERLRKEEEITKKGTRIWNRNMKKLAKNSSA
jgi:hypothetical protein